MWRRIPLMVCVVATVGLLCLAIGCAEDTSSAKATTRSGDALRDPFGYKPFRDEPTSISGGGLTEFDKKAMKHDLDSVFNP